MRGGAVWPIDLDCDATGSTAQPEVQAAGVTHAGQNLPGLGDTAGGDLDAGAEGVLATRWGSLVLAGQLKRDAFAFTGGNAGVAQVVVAVVDEVVAFRGNEIEAAVEIEVEERRVGVAAVGTGQAGDGPAGFRPDVATGTIGDEEARSVVAGGQDDVESAIVVEVADRAAIGDFVIVAARGKGGDGLLGHGQGVAGDAAMAQEAQAGTVVVLVGRNPFLVCFNEQEIGLAVVVHIGLDVLGDPAAGEEGQRGGVGPGGEGRGAGVTVEAQAGAGILGDEVELAVAIDVDQPGFAQRTRQACGRLRGIDTGGRGVDVGVAEQRSGRVFGLAEDVRVAVIVEVEDEAFGVRGGGIQTNSRGDVGEVPAVRVVGGDVTGAAVVLEEDETAKGGGGRVAGVAAARGSRIEDEQEVGLAVVVVVDGDQLRDVAGDEVLVGCEAASDVAAVDVLQIDQYAEFRAGVGDAATAAADEVNVGFFGAVEVEDEVDVAVTVDVVGDDVPAGALPADLREGCFQGGVVEENTATAQPGGDRCGIGLPAQAAVGVVGPVQGGAVAVVLPKGVA